MSRVCKPVKFNDIKINAGQWAIFPFNINITKEIKILSGTALPLGSYQHKTNMVHLFMRYEGVAPGLEIERNGKKYSIRDGQTIGRDQFVFLSEKYAQQLDENGEPLLLTKKENIAPSGIEIERPDSAHVVIRMQPGAMKGLNDIFFKIHYTGDFGQAFLDGELVADQFYYGDVWEIGLKRFAEKMQSGKPLYLYFHPMKKDAVYLKYFDKAPDFKGEDRLLEIKEIEVIGEKRE